MKQILNRISLVLILTLANTSIAQADYGSDQRDVFWFSSSTSSLLNRSSVELATKHVGRGIQFAHQALAKELNPMDELIAYHNLCIGYLASDRPEYASQFCARAFELAQGPYSVIKIRGALRLQGLDKNDITQITLSPLEVIISNIQQQKSGTRLTLLMK
ncbi:MAG: hypothetical protein IH836_08700 [Proteobacteria bacterium]|nr:hypothetical protein [Pseudomonadota bacterium]